MTQATTIDITSFADPDEAAWSIAEQEALRPRDDLLISEWATKHRLIRGGPRPGPWRHETAPFGIDIMDAYLDPTIEVVVVVAGAQISKTEVAIILPLLYTLLYQAEDAILMMVDDKLAEWTWENRILAAINDSPTLREQIPPPKFRGRRGDYHFNCGSTLSLVGANSIGRISSRSYRKAFADEVDKYREHLGEEADPLSLLAFRTSAYQGLGRKLGVTCTPTTELGLIWRYYRQGDRRHWFVKCPSCGEDQTMRFTFDDNSPLVYEEGRGARHLRKSARYVCPHCEYKVDDTARLRMLAAGSWRATADLESADYDATYRTFWYSALTSPLRRLPDIAAAVAKARGDPLAMRAVCQGDMGLPYLEELGEQLTTEHIRRRELPYARATVPEGVEVITGAVDVHAATLYYVYRGWSLSPDGSDPDSWLIEAGVVDRRGPELAPYLDEVAALAAAGWMGPGGELFYPLLTLIDTGYEAELVYQWVRGKGQRGWRGYKGGDQRTLQGRLTARRVVTDDRGRKVQLQFGDTSEWKRRVHALLRVPEGEPGYFGVHQATDAWYRRQITAEVYMPEHIKDGKRIKPAWHSVRRSNHVLDCEAMAACAASMIGAFGSRVVYWGPRIPKPWADKGRSATDRELANLQGMAGDLMREIRGE